MVASLSKFQSVSCRAEARGAIKLESDEERVLGKEEAQEKQNTEAIAGQE